MGRESEQCYCAFCKEPRRVYTKKHLTLVNISLCLVTSLLLMMMIWQQPDPRVFMLFVLCMVVSEVFIQIRWRVSIACPQCGFNPVLYIRSPEKAATRVSEFFENKKQNSSYYLTSNPLLKIARLQAKAKKQAAKGKAMALKDKNASGQLVSKTL